MASWGSSAFSGNYICMTGSWGSAGNYSKTLQFNNLSTNTITGEQGTLSPVGMRVEISSDKTNWKEITEFHRGYADNAGQLTSAELTKFSKTIDFSKYITPASGTYLYIRYQHKYRDGGANVTGGYYNLVNSALVDTSASLQYVKANEPISSLSATTSDTDYQDFDKPITLSWTAVTKTGTYAPHHYKIWASFSFDGGTTWTSDNNYIAPNWGVEGTSWTFTISNLKLDTQNLGSHSKFKIRFGFGTVDNPKGDTEATRSTIKYFVLGKEVVNTKKTGFLMVNGTDTKRIKKQYIKQIDNMNGMKIKILDDGSEWARIFWHDVSSTATYFTNESEVLSCNLSNRFSNLTNINNYRYNGAFELMLCYPKYSTSKYNRWIQRANPITTWETTKQTKSTMGYESIHIDFKTNWLYGMAQSSDSNTSNTRFDCMAGHTNWFGAIGQYKPYNGGFPAPTESGMSNMQKEVELWVRIDNTVSFNKTTGKMIAQIYDDEYFFDIMNYLHMGLITDNMVIELYNNITYSASWVCENFKGHIYGNGYTINITSQNVDCLFKQNSGIIEDLVIAGSNIKITSSIGEAGGICRVNTGKIINCINNRKIVGNESYPLTAGGICGENSGEIIKCLNRANIDNSSTTDASMITGGIVGKNSGLIQGCRSGTIDSQNEPYGTLKGYNVGGIIGYSLAGSKVQDCMSWNNLSGYYVGGIVGYSYKGEINHCINMSGINTETQSTTGTYYGGLCGYNNYGTYSNNFYDSIWARASVEYSASTQTNSKTVPNYLYRSSGIADMLGLPYIYVNTYNGGLPSFSWERATRIEPDSLWGITDNIWLDNYQVGEPTNIGIHFERSFGHNGKHKKLDILIETLYRTRWSSRYYI